MGVKLSDTEQRLEYAREVIRAEADVLRSVAERLNDTFLHTVDLLYDCTGRVGLTGTGKSADVAQKIVGTLNSTGTRAYLLDVTKAMHGDLGMVAPQDVVIALSHSGESEEVLRLLGPLKQLARAVIGLTSNPQGTLARESDLALVIGPITEACPLGLAPSTSTTAMLAVGDALAFVLSQMRQFNHEDFARYHPAGSLGRKLMRVEAVMRKGHLLRHANANATVRDVFSQNVGRVRRTGAVLLVDDLKRLQGIFTDSDLARLFEQRRDEALDRPIHEVMTRTPLTVHVGTRLLDALEIMQQHKISELPVLNDLGQAAGLLDITDLIGLLPAEMSQAQAPPSLVAA